MKPSKDRITYCVCFIKRRGSSRRRFHLGAEVIYLQLQIRDTNLYLYLKFVTFELRGSLGIPRPAPSTKIFSALAASLGIPSHPMLEG